MYEIAGKLEKLVKSWEKEHTDALLGSPSIALFTSFQAGNPKSPNKIADTAMATFDIRTTPSIHYKAVKIIQELMSAKQVLIDLAYDPLPYGYTDKTEHIVQVAQKITRAPVGASVGSTDLLFFTAANIPCIVFGPGIMKMTHTTDEYVEIKKLEECLGTYKKIIQEF